MNFLKNLGLLLWFLTIPVLAVGVTVCMGQLHPVLAGIFIIALIFDACAFGAFMGSL